MKLTFLVAGGTIDKDYPHTTKGWAFEFGEPAVNRIIQKLTPSFDYEVVTVFQKDSLEINQNDRSMLLDAIANSPNKRFIITHGTDTMPETAEFIAEQVHNKLIILTGAMRPERFTNSDADINIGGAIAACSVLQTGVYIFMHGILKPYDKINRDMETGQYY